MQICASRPIVLTVDDSPENLDFIVALLKNEYLVKVATNGHTALRIAAQEPQPDLILLDIVMPGMDGFEVCRQLKVNRKTAEIPVIFLTSKREIEDEIKGFSLGALDFISKPFRPSVVLARVRTHLELVKEKRKSESLLENILPQKVIKELKETGNSPPQLFEEVSVLFSDLVNFTNASSNIPPGELLEELTGLFSAFDQILKEHGAQRIKTIGDGYLGVCGMLDQISDHADRMVMSALDFIEFLENRNLTAKHKWQARIGIHTGPVVAGIVGKTRFQYDVFGDTVNVSSRVQSASEPMRVCISSDTQKFLQRDYIYEDRGLVDLKGKGLTPLLFILSKEGCLK
jgi:class 3 adenylate cyclase